MSPLLFGFLACRPDKEKVSSFLETELFSSPENLRELREFSADCFELITLLGLGTSCNDPFLYDNDKYVGVHGQYIASENVLGSVGVRLGWPPRERYFDPSLEIIPAGKGVVALVTAVIRVASQILEADDASFDRFIESNFDCSE
jgi:hypothetical protein